MCRQTVDRNPTGFAQCKLRANKRFSGIVEKCTEKIEFVWGRATEAINNNKCSWEIDVLKFPRGFPEIINCFCYVGDLINSGRRCSECIVNKICIDWRTLRKHFVGNKKLLIPNGTQIVWCVYRKCNANIAVNAEDMSTVEKNETNNVLLNVA